MELDKYGRMAKSYLESNRPEFLKELTDSGELDQYLKRKMQEVHASIELVIGQIQEKHPEMSMKQAQSLAEELMLPDLFPVMTQS